MRFKTNQEQAESAERILQGAKEEISKVEYEIRTKIENMHKDKNAIKILYLKTFYDVEDEVFQIHGIFTFYGRMFYTYAFNTTIFGGELANDTIREASGWVEAYKIFNSKLKSKRDRTISSTLDNNCMAAGPFYEFGQIEPVNVQIEPVLEEALHINHFAQGHHNVPQRLMANNDAGRVFLADPLDAPDPRHWIRDAAEELLPQRPA
jgi:uncharacterized protein YqgQ